MTDDTTDAERFPSIEPGTVVYDEDGDAVGTVSGFTDDGFEVAAPEDDPSEDALREGGATPGGSPSSGEDRPASSTGEESPGQEFGEGYLMWRCDECGEMGDLEDGMPDACPNCGAPKTALYRTEED